MKKIILLICFLFLFSTLNCATTKAPVKLATGDFDLTGTWEQTENSSGCDTSSTTVSKVVITQDGDMVTAENMDKGWKWTHPVVNGAITIPKAKMGKVSLKEYQLLVMEGADLLTARILWNYDGLCNGKTLTTYKRQ